MTTITLIAHEQQLLLTSERPISAGDRETVEIKVTADESWRGYRLSAMMWREGEMSTAVLTQADEEGRCPIPPLLTATPCLLGICVTGESEEGRVRTTTVVRYPILPGAPTEHTAVLADVSDGTATPAQVLAGATFYAAESEQQTGIIPSYTDGELLTREIPLFDLAAAGLPRLDFSGSLAYCQTDMSALVTALRDTPATLRFLLLPDGESEPVTVEAIPHVRFAADGHTLADCFIPTSTKKEGVGMLDVAHFEIDYGQITAYALHIGSDSEEITWQSIIDRPFEVLEDGTVIPLDNRFLEPLETVVKETDILPACTVEGFALSETYGAYTPGFSAADGFALNALEIYNVEWDGVFYTCNAFTFEIGGDTLVGIGNGAYVGQAGNDEPFLLAYSQAYGTKQFFSNTAETSHTVRVYQTAPAYRLRADYLPTEAIREQIDEIINEALGGDY